MHPDPLGAADGPVCDPVGHPQRAASAQPGGWGLVAWEQTLGDVLSEAGYGCAVYGKWHVGEGPGRWPTDKGFEEWYGPPRTYDEALWPTDPWYDPQRDPVSRMVEIKQGDADVTEGDQLTLEVRRDCDAEYLRRAEAFIRGQAARGAPFFVYFNHSLMHMPVIPRPEFKGQTGQGDWADSLLELDTDFGDAAGPARRARTSPATPWSSSPGTTARRTCCCGAARPATGRAPTSPAERATCAPPASCAGPVTSPPGSSQRRDHARHRLVHHPAARRRARAARRPGDRRGQPAAPGSPASDASSQREGYLYWMGPEMYGVKWRNFKLALVTQKYSTDPVAKLSTPRLINLITDPQEREPLHLPYLHSWTVTHFNKLIAEFQASIQREPPVPPARPWTTSPRNTTSKGTMIAERSQHCGGSRAKSRLIEPEGAAVCRSVREARRAGSRTACRSRWWPGFRTRCQPAGPCRGVARKRRERQHWY